MKKFLAIELGILWKFKVSEIDKWVKYDNASKNDCLKFPI